MKTIDEKAPAFKAMAYTQYGPRQVKLSDYEGRWVLLMFFVTDFSAVCPTETIAFNSEYEKFSSKGAEILGISVDTLDVHEKFVGENLNATLNFPLISDKSGAIAKKYGVYNSKKKTARRSLVMVDPEGKIKYVAVSDNRVGRSTNETYRVLRALQSGGACAVNWEPKD